MQLELIKQCDFDTETKKLIAKYIIGAASAISTIYIIKKLLNKYKCNKEILKKKKDVNDRKVALLQKLEGMVLPFENIKNICHLSGEELLTKIHAGEFKPVDILEAYQANALLQNNQLNFVADIIYDADVSALMLHSDDERKLLGWPLSVKDVFWIKNYDCTQGLHSKILKPCFKTSVIIKALKENGAIPFIITNVPQGLQDMESSNPIFGKTINPFNHNMSCGGSSAGEGTALGSGSSLIGIGNDFGGSIRIPASYCGIYGLKPTSSRVSSRHVDKLFYCDLIFNASIGPMARHMGDLVETFRAMTTDHIFEMDPYTPPVPFKDLLFLSKKRLKIGFFNHIGGKQAHPVPSVERAVLLAKKALEKAGHEVIEFMLPNIDELGSLKLQIFSIDCGKILLEEGLKNGPVDPSLKPWVRILRSSRFMKRFLSCLYRLFDKEFSESIHASLGSSVYETWKLKDQLMAYRELVLTELDRQGLDGLLCPVLPIVAPPLDTCNTLSNIDIYCAVYNLLDYPAGTVPVTQVTEEDIRKLDTDYQATSGLDRKLLKFQRQSLKLPVGVQCVARPWHDETCLRIMKDVVVHL